MHKSPVRAAVCVFFLCGMLAGCNVFDGLGEEGDSNDPYVLLRDARAALSRGEPQEAVRYLERAFDLDPNNPEVRIELVGARFAAAEVDLLTLGRLVDHINGEGDTTSTALNAAWQGKANGAFCTFDADPSELEMFDYTSAPEYQQIRDHIDTFVAAHDLLEGIRPAALGGLSEEARAQWYLTRAFTRIALAIHAINEEVARIDATLYRLPRFRNSIGICAASESALDQAEARIKCDLLPQILVGLDELEMRSQLLDDADKRYHRRFAPGRRHRRDSARQ